MKISLLEFDYHPEVIRSFLRIIDRDKIDLKIYTLPRIWKRVNRDEFQNVIFKDPKQSLKDFLHQHLAEINASDLILLNTVASHFKTWCEIELSAPVLLRIHNGNANFNRLSESYKPIWTPFFIWKDLKYLIPRILFKREDRYQKRLIEKIDHFAFPNEVLKDFSVEKYQLKASNCWALPFSFWEDKQPQKEIDPKKVQITIIGKIDRRNRDYEKVVKAFVILSPLLKSLKTEVELCLLGKDEGAYAHSIVKALKSLESDYFKLQTYSKFVPQDEFEAKIENTDFLIIPTRIETRFTIFREWYGSTKISGGTNDVIRHHRFAFIEGEYPTPANISNAFSPYHSPQDLAEKISLQIQSREYARKDFSKILSDYQLEKVREQNLAVFEAVIANS